MRYLMAGVAFVTCPCHLPIWLVALSGTALGAAVAEHAALAILALSVVFVVSTWSAVRLFRGRR